MATTYLLVFQSSFCSLKNFNMIVKVYYRKLNNVFRSKEYAFLCHLMF